jgi:type III secretion system YscD/HrpQ family protein
MSESSSAEPIILKILSGVQSGAEVSLTPGEYTIGSGDGDDIQLIDVSLRPAQGRLRIGQGKIEIAGGSGGLVTANGLAVAAGGDTWQEVEPLDIITAGTIRFALGPASANWTTLTAHEEMPPTAKAPRKPAARLSAMRIPSSASVARLVGPAFIVVLLAVAGIGAWYLSSGPREAAPKVERDEAAVVRTLLDEYPFGKSIAVRREVDGTIYATGFVETNVERRALAGAIDKSGIAVRLRLGVLESLRNEIASLIQVENVPVTFTLSGAGDLTLDGLILREDELTKFLDRIKASIIGLNKVTSNVRTARTLLADLVELANGLRIEPWVLFRLDGNLIEASGSLPDEKKEAWLRFLQGYSRRFSKDIALRSLVHLQNANGGDPITFDRDMLDRIARGEVDPNELLSGMRRSAPVRASATTTEANLPKAMPANAKTLQAALRTWETVRADLDRLDRVQIAKKYLKQQGGDQPASCRQDSRLTASNLPQALFWLDLLSVSSEMSLVKFGADEQAYILEAALDPTLVTDCLARLRVHTDSPSLYMAEAAGNPDFIRFVTRDFPVYGSDITGASLTSSRYIQLRDGKKMREGAPPSSANELSIVGELGIAVAGKDGYSIALYGPQISWMGRSNTFYGSHGNWIWN